MSKQNATRQITGLLVILAALGILPGARPAWSPATAAASAVSSHLTSISSGYYSSCGVEVSGSLVCWGDDETGESEPPTGRFGEVSVGNDGVCAIRRTGSVTCWGPTGLPLAATLWR